MTNPMRFRFTIRDLLWLTVGVALAVGWWLDSYQLTIYRKNAALNAARAKAVEKDAILAKNLVP